MRSVSLPVFARLALLLGLLLPALWGMAAERLFFQAESMSCDGKNWQVVDHFDGWYNGLPSGGKMLWGGQGGQGTATKKGMIKKAGTYKVWSRHMDAPVQGPFKLTFKQEGAVVGEITYETKSLRQTEAEKAKWGAGYGTLVWESGTVELKAGPVEVVLTKADPLNPPHWMDRYLDCFVLTDDLNYEPDIKDFASPLYLKIKMGASLKVPCVVHLWGFLPAAPWFLQHNNIYTDGMVAGAYTGFKPKGPNPNFFSANGESTWVNIAPLLAQIRESTVLLTAEQDYPTPLPAVDFTAYLSRTPSEEGLIKKFTRTGSGGGMLLLVNPLKPEEVRSDLECSGTTANYTATLPPTPGKRPAKFPVITGCNVASDFYQPRTMSNETNTLSAMGISSIAYPDPFYEKHGFRGIVAFNTIGHLTQGYNFCQPKTTEIHDLLRSAAQTMIDKGRVKDVITWNLMDEPNSVSLDHMIGCPVCAKGPREYLQKAGMQPADFGKQTWEEIAPVKDGKGNAKLYYYTALYRNQVIANLLKIGTDSVRELIPDAKTCTNIAEDLTYGGNMLANGVDYFLLQKEAVTYGWEEDWMNASCTAQLSGYRADFLRAACNQRGQEFGGYVVIKEPWDTAAKAAVNIGHGYHSIYYYNYGPQYVCPADAHSFQLEIYPALREVNYGIGAVEDYLLHARVPQSKIALLYSHTTDIWTLGDNTSNFGKERMGLYLILRHLGYPVDILTEQDLLEKKAAPYQMIFLVGSHIRAEAVPPLRQWVRDGGRLYCAPGSLQYDQFNKPLGLDDSLGISRKAYEVQENFGIDAYCAPRKVLDTVDYHGQAMEAICGLQRMTTPEGATVLATFADKSPAVCSKPEGKGAIVFSSFFPGLAYLRAGVITRDAYWKVKQKENKRPASFTAKSYPPAYRALFSAMLQGLPYQPAASTSNYLVEANLMESDNGIVVTLANWNGEPLKDVTITVRTTAKVGKPFAAINKLKSVVQKNGEYTLTLDLNITDFIVFPYAKK